MNTLDEWAQHWGIGAAALFDLRKRMGHDEPAPSGRLRSETAVLTACRLRASALGWRLWRNNVGAFVPPEGGMVRFGLANDSAALNRVVKSGDLIGIRPRVIAPNDVGRLIGQFVSIECKHEGWSFTGTDREVAQERWVTLVQSLGGEARFVSSETSL